MIFLEKIFRYGCLFFAVALFALSVLKYTNGQRQSGMGYLIGAFGFLIVFASYLLKKKFR
jgi:hypothetical protein